MPKFRREELADGIVCYLGDCRDVLTTLPDESVHCCVTSPPYWGLRDYGTAKWEGGDPECDHKSPRANKVFGNPVFNENRPSRALTETPSFRDACGKCGAIRIDAQIGLESSPDEYVSTMVGVFREVLRVLRNDGTLWLNLGDSYAAQRGGTHQPAETLAGGVGGLAPDGERVNRGRGDIYNPSRYASRIGLKHKDLCGIPWRVAFALQADGWYLRQDIIWCLSGGAWLYARTANGCVGPMMLKDLTRLKPETVELWTGERWSRVVSWTRTEGRSGAREIVLRSGERIGCTDGHVWPTQRGDVRTSDLRRGDMLLTTRLPTGGREAAWLTADAFWFAGLYLAEGSRSGTTIQIAGHIKEEVRLARLRELVRHYGGSVRAYNHRGKGRNIHIDSPALSAVLQTLIAGHTAKDKHLTQGAWEYRDWALKEMATGYLDGDGHYDAKNERWRLGFCRNYLLERDLRAMAARLGATLTLNPNVSKNQSGKQFPSFKGEWRWVSNAHHNGKRRSEVIEVRNSRARQFWDVEIADYPHLFALASGVLTHNSKPNPMPESVRDRCTKAHEYIFLLSKSQRYYYDADAIAERASNVSGFARERRDGKNTWNYGRDGYNKTRIGGMSGKETFENSETRNKRSVWEIATQPFSEAHFATFPPALIEPCILAGCPKDGTVLDPFGGAGTTGLVCINHARKFIGIELNHKYMDMACKRMIKAVAVPNLFVRKPKIHAKFRQQSFFRKS